MALAEAIVMLSNISLTAIEYLLISNEENESTCVYCLVSSDITQ